MDSNPLEAGGFQLNDMVTRPIVTSGPKKSCGESNQGLDYSITSDSCYSLLR